VFNAIVEARLGLSTAKQVFAWSSGKRAVAEASATEAGRIRPKTRTIVSRVVRSVFLFFIAASDYPLSEN
jgi:hypothetical protein